MKGPSTYKSSDLQPSAEFPNIDIGPNDYSVGRASYSAGNKAYQNQLDAPYLGSNSNLNSNIRAAPHPPSKGPTSKVNFPTKSQPNNQQFNMDKGNNSQRYVSNENVHLHQIIQESGFIGDNIDRN